MSPTAALGHLGLEGAEVGPTGATQPERIASTRTSLPAVRRREWTDRSAVHLSPTSPRRYVTRQRGHGLSIKEASLDITVESRPFSRAILWGCDQHDSRCGSAGSKTR